MSDRRALAIIEQAEGRKLCDEALREIQLGHTDFASELARFKNLKSSCKQRGDAKLCKHWTIAERLLKKARAEVITDPPTDESAVL